MSEQSDKIAALNDAFRTTFTGGRVVVTQGVGALGPEAAGELLRKVREFCTFCEDNDPHGEHDFGNIEHGGDTYFWKIDYYDPTITYGSEDPSDPCKTVRVLTLMQSGEY